MEKRSATRFAALALAMALAAGLAACGDAASERHAEPPRQEYEEDHESPVKSAPEQSAEPDASTEAQTQEPDVESDTQSSSDRIWERLERIRKAQEQAGNSAADDSAADAGETEPDTDMSGLEAVARLAELTGSGELFSELHDTVDVNDSHNPYDLVWQYGDKRNEENDDFGALYASYVDAADWSLVFDAEYYKKAFPMLAKLYHQDDALLLEHFQTVGVHEGRQGSRNFNVSVYMANCDKTLRDMFGDNYECYYFYYMLNYADEGKVTASGVYGKDPLWLDLELTRAQASELGAVNRYREEVGAEPMELDPENIAFANYRAWYNAANSLRGHGWMEDRNNPDVDVVFDILGVNHLGENTITSTGEASKDSTLMPYYVNYRYSKDHYEAMVRPKHLYLGVSHMYYNGDTNWMCQFDTFLYTKPVPDYTMR